MGNGTYKMVPQSRNYTSIQPHRLALIIKAHRNRLGISQGMLAEQVGVTQQTISKWERDMASPSPDMIVTLAAIIGVFSNEERGAPLSLHSVD